MSGTDRRRELESNRRRADRWEVEFPYEWDADDLISRRHLLRWSVMASGALFAATGLLAGLGFVREQPNGGGRRIVEESEVPPGSAYYFEYGDTEEQSILLHLEDGRFVAYRGVCTHLECGVYWDPDIGELVCPCHEGYFDPTNGEVLAGPPTRPLPRIPLRSEAGVLYTAPQEES